MNRYKWQKSGEVALDRETNTSFRVNVPSAAAARFAKYLADGGEVEAADPEPEIVRYIERNMIYDRLKTVGLLSTALAVLDAPENREMKAYWDGLTIGVKQDDQRVRAFLSAIGATPEEILA